MNNMLQQTFRSVSNLLSSKHFHLIKSLPYLKRKRRIALERLDYIRLSTLELTAEEIYKKRVPGNVAELGVYRGDFAKDLNAIFPDKLLYLFDTFAGFDQRDIPAEVKQGFSSGTQDFSDTSVELVLAKMPLPRQCIVKKGFFPGTAADLDEQFCFVSIDADLFEPVLAGLNYFFPRLSKGGYIFVHDFNNSEYLGAAEALNQFCTQNNCGFVPIADIGGTAIICK